jgi:hypothetical protein
MGSPRCERGIERQVAPLGLFGLAGLELGGVKVGECMKKARQGLLD